MLQPLWRNREIILGLEDVGRRHIEKPHAFVCVSGKKQRRDNKDMNENSGFLMFPRSHGASWPMQTHQIFLPCHRERSVAI
jgi:hypothetical protein